MHSRHDQSVDPASMPLIYQRLGTQEKRMVWLENSGHIVTEDYDRELVYRTIGDFVEG
jgi:carboxylesterase